MDETNLVWSNVVAAACLCLVPLYAWIFVVWANRKVSLRSIFVLLVLEALLLAAMRYARAL